MKQLFLATFVFLFSLYAFSADDAATPKKEGKPAKPLSLSDVTNFLTSDTSKDKKTEKDSISTSTDSTDSTDSTTTQTKNAFQLLSKKINGDLSQIGSLLGIGKWNNSEVANVLKNNQAQLAALLKIADYDYCAGPPIKSVTDKTSYAETWPYYSVLGMLAAEYHLRNKQHQKGIDCMNASLDLGAKILKSPNAFFSYGIAGGIAQINADVIERFYKEKLISTTEKKELAKKLPSRNDLADGYLSIIPGEKRSLISWIEGIQKNDKKILEAKYLYSVQKNEFPAIKQMTKEDITETIKLFEAKQKEFANCIRTGKKFSPNPSGGLSSKGGKLLISKLEYDFPDMMSFVNNLLDKKNQLLK